MTSRTIRRREVTRIIAVLALAVSVWLVGWQGRVSDHSNLIRGCERGLSDRRADVERDHDDADRDRREHRSWRDAARARRADGDLEVSKRYARASRRAGRSYLRAERRAGRTADRLVPCATAYPKPGPLPEFR